MKSQIRSILFAVLIPACGADREATTVGARELAPASVPVAPAATATPAPIVGKASDAVPVVAAVPATFDTALAEGRALVAKGDRVAARAAFEAAGKLDKHRAEPHVELARLFVATGDRGLAVAAANRAVKLAPLSSQAWNTKGRAELARFDYDAAIEAFSKAVELDRDNVWAWNNLGLTELQLKKYDDAASYLTEATSRTGATGYMWNNLGTALELLDRLDEARHAFEEGATRGSPAAVASRKRLEGVKTLAIAKQEQQTVKIDAEAGYELNEGRTDEDVQKDVEHGSGSGSDEGSAGAAASGEGSGSGSASDQATN